MAEQQSGTDARQPGRASDNGGATTARKRSEQAAPEETGRSGKPAARRGDVGPRAAAPLVERDPFMTMDRMARDLEQVWEALYGRRFGMSPFRGRKVKDKPEEPAEPSTPPPATEPVR